MFGAECLHVELVAMATDGRTGVRRAFGAGKSPQGSGTAPYRFVTLPGLTF